MTEVGSTDKLAPALVALQFAIPTIPKNRTAKIPTKSGGSYSYSYADLSDIWDAIRGPLKDNGLAVTQCLAGGSNGFIGIQTIVWHESGQYFHNTVEVATADKNAQEIGSQITYFKRYALAAALGISTEDDDDGKAASFRSGGQTFDTPPRPKVTVPQPKPNQQGQDALLRAIQSKGLDAEAVANAFQERFGQHPRFAGNDELMAFALLVDEGAVGVG